MSWIIKKISLTLKLKYLATKIKRDGGNLSVLDVGAGHLPYADIFLTLGFAYHAIDNDSNYVPEYEKKKLDYPALFSYEIADIREYKMDRQFGFLLCFNVLHFF